MAWDQLEVDKPHVAYATTAFALLLFGTISLFLKEKVYIGETTVATIYGLIVGPHCLNWFAPTTWGNSDWITLELSRIVLVVQIFAVAVELPSKYILKHWWSMFVLLIPGMIYGWLVSSVFIYLLIPTLRWIEALAVAGCITATDPVLAAAVVGKGKFSRRIPGHLRNLLSAESACNDGMAFPFVILAVIILQHEHHSRAIAKHFIVIAVLYEVIFGCVLGTFIGWGGRLLIRFAERFNLIDRESFLVYYFCLALFCAGVGTVIGVDDLLVAFAAGTAFSWDGWFVKKTEESEVSNVIDMLLNTAYFVYFGSIIPWELFNEGKLGLNAWRLVVIAIIILILRRIPALLVAKLLVKDLKTWREALFCGHFGPIGVGGLFMAILARAELETHSTTPLGQIPPEGSPHYMVIATVWPITCFLVLSSIIVHGSSIAVFTLGKRINNIAITLTYTTAGNGPSWLSRLPERMGAGDELKLETVNSELPFGGRLRRRHSSRKMRKRKSKRGSLDKEKRSHSVDLTSDVRGENENVSIASLDEQALRISGEDVLTEASFEEDKQGTASEKDKHLTTAPKSILVSLIVDVANGHQIRLSEQVSLAALENKDFENFVVYQEEGKFVVSDGEGGVVHVFDVGKTPQVVGTPRLEIHSQEPIETQIEQQEEERGEESKEESESARGAESSAPQTMRRGQRVYAYMADNDVIIENSDGEVLQRYRVHDRGEPPKQWKGPFAFVGNTVDYILKRARFHKMFPSHPSESHSQKGSHESHLDVEHEPSTRLERVEDDESLTSSEENVIVDALETMTSGHRRQASGLSQVSYESNGEEEDEEAYEFDHQTVTLDDDEDEEETEIERRRRFAALGIAEDTRRNQRRRRSGYRPELHVPHQALHRRVSSIPEEESVVEPSIESNTDAAEDLLHEPSSHHRPQPSESSRRASFDSTDVHASGNNDSGPRITFQLPRKNNA